MMSKLKKFAPSAAKKLYRLLRSRLPAVRNQIEAQKFAAMARDARVLEYLTLLFAKGSPEISNGPFKGMSYIASAKGSQLLPKLIGCYEEPIHDWTEEIVKAGYQRIIDLGCAEGYYAVGLKLRSPRTEVFAFDTDSSAIEVAKLLALKNQINVTFGGLCDHSLLESTIQGRTLVFCDIEGGELGLLDPEKVPSLRSADLLVEAHDCFVCGITETLIERFHMSHRISIRVDYPFRYGSYQTPSDAIFTHNDIKFMQDELRPPKMRWLYMKAVSYEG